MPPLPGRLFSPLFVCLLLVALLVLAGCAVKADLAFSPLTEAATGVQAAPTATTPANKPTATTAPEVTVSPTASPPITLSYITVLVPPAAQSVLSVTNIVTYTALRYSPTEVMTTALKMTAPPLAVVRPNVDDSIPPTSLISTTLYLFSKAYPSTAVCAPGGVLVLVLPPSGEELGLQAPVTIQRPLQQLCGLRADTSGEVLDALCPQDKNCAQHSIDYLYYASNGGELLISDKAKSPGGEGPPAYCHWVCPSGGGVCKLIGC